MLQTTSLARTHACVRISIQGQRRKGDGINVFRRAIGADRVMGLKGYKLTEVELKITHSSKTIKYLLRSGSIARDNS
jgi:hypothetical protein